MAEVEVVARLKGYKEECSELIVELDTKVKRRFVKISIVSNSRPSLMIIVCGVPIISTIKLSGGERSAAQERS